MSVVNALHVHSRAIAQRALSVSTLPRLCCIFCEQTACIFAVSSDSMCNTSSTAQICAAFAFLASAVLDFRHSVDDRIGSLVDSHIAVSVGPDFCSHVL